MTSQPVTREQLNELARTNPRPADCPQCKPGYPVPHWPVSHCRSSIRENGEVFRLHCTCDLCF